MLQKLNFSLNMINFKFLCVAKFKQADKSNSYMYMVEFPPNKGYFIANCMVMYILLY